MDNFRDSYFQVDWDLTSKRLKGTYWGKQYDTGRGFVVTVINGGQVVAPTTEVLRLKWEKPDNTTGYVNATIVNGKFIVENIDQMFTVHGSVRADFELSVGGEFVASITFYVNVEKAVAVDAIESSSDFSAFQQSVADFSTAMEAVTPIAEEVIDARDGEVSVGAKIRSVTAQLAQTLLNQVDFVELVEQHSPLYTKMDFVKVGENKYRVKLTDGEKGVIYQFVKDTNDDFIKIDACYTGIGVGTDFVEFLNPTEDFNGVWNTSTSTWYTTEVGATFTKTIQGGSTIEVRFSGANNGGLWKIVVDGDEGNAVEVSTHIDADNLGFVKVAEGLDGDEPHTIVGTFMGDDPQNPPSTSPSRGYLRYGSEGMILGGNIGASATNMVLADGSNKELAFTVTKDGYHNWIPDHGEGAAFNIKAPEFVLDGEIIDISTLEINKNIACNTFELRQKFNGIISATSTNVAEFNTIHRIKKNGVLEFSGRLVAITDFKIMGYPLMLPAYQTFTDEFVSGILNSKVNDKSDVYDYFTEEGDRVYSGAVVSSTNRNLVGAGTLTTPLLTYREGKEDKPPEGEQLFVWHRATKPKMYWQSMAGRMMEVGDAYAWGFRMVVADIDGIYNMIKQ